MIPSPCVKSSQASPCTISLRFREDRKRIQTKYFSYIFSYFSHLVCSDAVLGPWYTTTAVSDAVAAAAAAACSSAPASRPLAPLPPVRLRLGPDPDPDCCPVGAFTAKALNNWGSVTRKLNTVFGQI
jgi:hypothetical protein